METDLVKNSNLFFVCKFCDYKCYKTHHYTQHKLTAKHLRKQNGNGGNQNIVSQHFQCGCGNTYKNRDGLWKHKKKCNFINLTENSDLIDISETNIELEQLSNIVFDMVKQNQEFKQLILDQNKQIVELVGKPNTITNNNNTMNNFNLNFFLNETCKDAMNLTDFVNSLTLSLTDLENTGKVGYEEGISQIFINGLKDLAIDKRPIHCSDIKREKLYIKNENIWGKDSEQENIKKSIRKVANKNMNQIADWIKANPESQSFINPKNYNSKKNDEYLNMVLKATGGSTKEEEEKKICKVVSNIARHVEIDKTM